MAIPPHFLNQNGRFSDMICYMLSSLPSNLDACLPRWILLSLVRFPSKDHCDTTKDFDLFLIATPFINAFQSSIPFDCNEFCSLSLAKPTPFVKEKRIFYNLLLAHEVVVRMYSHLKMEKRTNYSYCMRSNWSTCMNIWQASCSASWQQMISIVCFVDFSQMEIAILRQWNCTINGAFPP